MFGRIQAQQHFPLPNRPVMQQVVLVLFFLFGFAVQTNLDALEGDTLLINLKSGELCVTQHFFCDKNLPWYLPFTDVSDAEHFSTETYEVRVVTKGDTCVLPHQDPISLNLQDFTVCFYGLPLIIIANNMEEEQQIQNSLGIASSPGQPTIYQSKICTPFMSLGEGITTCYGTNSGESSVMSRAPCPEVNTDTYTLVSLTCDGEFIVTANSIVFAGTDITIIASSGIQFVSANRISWSGGGSLTFRTENRIAINASSSIDISSLLTLEAKQVQITAQEELELMNSFLNITSSGSVDLRSVTQAVTLERVTVAPLDSTVPIVVINSGPNVAWDAVTLSRFSCKATASILGHSTSGTGIVIRDSIFYHDLEATGYGCTGIKLEEENRFVSGTLTGYVTDSCASDGDNVYGFRGRSSGSILPLDGLTLLNMTVTGIVNTDFPFNPDRIGVFIENNCEWTAHNLTVIGSTNNAGIVDEYYADLSKGVSWIGNVEVEQHITQCNIIGTSDVGIGVYMDTPNLQYKANIEGNGGEIGIDISDYSFYDDTTLRGVGTDIGILVQGSSEYGYSEYEIFCIDDKTVIIDGTGETGVLFSDPYATNINFQITGNGTTNSIIMDEFHFVCDDISLAVSSITPGLIHFDLLEVQFSATNSVIQFLSPATVATLQIHGDDTKIYMKDGKIDDLILGLLPSVYMCGNYSIGLALALSVNSELVATCAPSIGIGIGELIFHFHQEGDTIEMPLITGNVPLTIHSYMQNILFNEIGSQGDLQKCPTSLTVTVPSNKSITTQGNIYTNSYQYYSAPSFYQERNSAIFRSMDSIYFDVDILDYRTVTIHAINCTFPSQLTGLAFNEGHKIIFDEPTTILMDGHVENVQIGMFEDGGGGGLPMAKAMDDIYLLGTGMIDNLEILTNSTFVIINPSPTAGGSSRFRVDNLSMTVGAELQLQMDILNNTFHSGFNLGINPVDTMQVKLISSRPITTSSQFDLVTVNNAASGALSLIDQNRTPIVLGSLLTPDLPAPNQFLVNTFSELLFSVILAPSPTPSSTSTRTRTPSLSRTPSATRPASPSIRPSSNSRTPLPESASISISIPISISPSLRQSNPPISRSPSPTLLVAEPSITLRTSNAPTVVPPPTEIPSHQPSPSSTPVPVLIRPPSVIVPATAPSGVSIILSEPDPEVIAASDTTTVFSNVINLETPSPIALGGYVEICLEPEHENIDPDDLCLGFLDETKNPPEWKCQDSCLTRVETGLLCGETDHFTNFALLLDGNGNSGSSCTSSFNTYITGTWFGDFLLIIVSIIIVIVTLIVLVVLIDHFGPCTRFALGKEGYRVYLTRSGYKSNRGTIMNSSTFEDSLMNSSTFEDGNIMNNTGDGSMVNPVLA